MKVFPLVVLLCAVGSPSVAQEHAVVVHTLDITLQQKTRSLNPEYLVSLPSEGTDTKIPLLIYLHGAGGIGDRIDKIRRQSARVCKGVVRFDKGPCIVVAPQCLKQPGEGKHAGWLPEDLNVLLGHLTTTLPVDERRIYLTGNSMGGYGSWVWGAHNPEHFAAIAPVVGGIGRRGPKDVTPDLDQWAANLAKVPVYAFVGAKDRVVPAEPSERMVAAIRDAGGKDVRIKIYPDEGHGAGHVVFSTSEFYDWMFSKKSDSLTGDTAEPSTARCGVPRPVRATAGVEEREME